MKLLLVEDDPRIADFIKKGMTEAGFFIDHRSDGESGLHSAMHDDYDAAIIDIMLPKLDGVSLIETLRSKGVRLPVLILSAKRALDDRVNGLQRGGDDYLTKPFSFVELLARVQALVRRASNVVESAQLTVSDLTIDLLARTVVRDRKKIHLQPREFALLEYLMRNKGHVVSKTMIMERVWSYNFDPRTNVVEARISRLREKLDKGFEVALIHTVRGMGYVLKEGDV
ncbi:MAG: response regulator transcription factor [Gammaproteobacteria bacterium]|nr:response regulator transcription factor [Gammaproteobacteria bacterium]